VVTVVPRLLRVVRRVLGAGHPDLEDVTYEAAHAVVSALPRFRGDGTVLHFACRVAVLTAMNVRRREAAEKRACSVAGGDPEHCADLAPSPEQTTSAASLAPLVREMLSELPETLAETLTLHVVLGYTIAEIAQSSGAPVETVRSRLRLAKRALRKRALDHPALREVLEADA
jgi:RNA polymerase sigma-70 factor (ECF subfamily)